MKVQLKIKDGTKWKSVNVAEIKGMSLLEYMINTNKTAVAAMMENDKPILIVSNEMEQVNNYKDKTTSLHTSDMVTLLGGVKVPDIALRVFPDMTFESFEPEKDVTQWW